MNAELQHRSPEPDFETIRQFASLVFGGLDGFVAVRLLPEKGTEAARARSNFEAIDYNFKDALYRHARVAANAGLACYVVPGTVRKRGTATARDIVATLVILVDLDAGDIAAKRAHLEEHLGRPSLEVASGGVTAEGQRKLHLYWRLIRTASGPDLAEACRVRGLIARKVGGDVAFASAHQPIRLAGSVHCKHGKRAFVEILASSPTNYDVGALAAAADAMPVLDSPSASEVALAAKPGARELLTRTVREGAVDGITRFDAISSVIGHYLRQARAGHVTRAEAWDAVRDHNATMIQPPRDEVDLRRDFERIEACDRRNHGALPSPDGQEGKIDGLSEDDLARSLAATYGARWKHVAAWGAWLEWTGTHWRSDSQGGIVELCRAECRRFAEGLSAGNRRRLLSERTIRAIERLARSDPRMAADAAQWDAEPMRLNTPGGIIDLVTGEISANVPDALMIRMTGGSLGNSCPLWRSFIDTITGGDADLAAYLMRVAGYCLTGSMSEQVFFFFHGAGGNGKTVLLGTLADVLGSYAATAPMETFMASRGDRHPADLAALSGARLVTITETEPGRAWAESRIKAITGGDAISVRFMHGNFFESHPRYKLVIAGNHRPHLVGGGVAMRRRLHLIPFEVTIAENQRDKDLLEKLSAERDGILGWAVDGCFEWQRIGLAPPVKVLEAAKDYFEDEDQLGQWIAECCETKPSHRAVSRALYASWMHWAKDAGIEAGSNRDLGEKLKERGFEPYRKSGSRGWLGIALRRDRAAPEGEGES